MIGVPQVLEELLTGNRSTERSDLCGITPRGNGVHHSSPGSLCSTLKALLMSSSYRVRSAAARLVVSLCGVGTSSSAEPADHESEVESDNDKVERFFRETLLAAGTTGKPRPLYVFSVFEEHSNRGMIPLALY